MSFLDDAKDKAQDVASDHEDQVDQGMEKVGDFADDKTGGKYSDQIDSGQEKAGDFLSGGDEGGDENKDNG